MSGKRFPQQFGKLRRKILDAKATMDSMDKELGTRQSTSVDGDMAMQIYEKVPEWQEQCDNLVDDWEEYVDNLKVNKEQEQAKLEAWKNKMDNDDPGTKDRSADPSGGISIRNQSKGSEGKKRACVGYKSKQLFHFMLHKNNAKSIHVTGKSSSTAKVAVRIKRDANIGMTNLKDIQKMNYLVGLLDGPALKIASRYPVIGSNYLSLIQDLKSHFANYHRIKLELKTKLRGLPGATRMDYSEIMEVKDEIQAILCQMQIAGMDINTEDVQDMIISKFPVKIQVDMIGKQRARQVTLVLLKSIQHNLEKLELEDEANQRNNWSKTLSFQQHGQQESGSQAQINGASPQPTQPFCIFCHESHWWQQCEKYATPEVRKQKLMLDRKCWNCGRQGHSIKECKSNKVCRLCHQKHHTSICPGNGNGTTSSAPQSTVFCQPSGNFKQTMETNGKTSVIKHAANMFGIERVVMEPQSWTSMAQQVIAANPTDHGKKKAVIMVYDNGSTYSCITRKLAKELQLPITTGCTFIQTTIAGTTTTTRENIVKVDVKHETSCVGMDLITVETIGNGIMVAVNGQPEMHQADILVGQDMFPNMVPLGKVENDRWFVNTILGPAEMVKTDHMSIQATRQMGTASESFKRGSRYWIDKVNNMGRQWIDSSIQQQVNKINHGGRRGFDKQNHAGR
uniref:CCHC-type domain-containing protein n=1 Tax=Panagrolaimus sp. JU765 TaxID=591449 RepID=A0AC34RID4_9BILA